MAWITTSRGNGVSNAAGRTVAARLNRIHLAVARRTPHLPGNFDDVDDFVHPLVLLYPLVLPATFGDRLRTPLGLSGTSEPMKAAWRRWAQAIFRSLERESGPLAEEAFPADWSAVTEFALKFESRSYEQTDSGHRVAIVMMDVFSRRWFPARLRAFGNDLTRQLAGERVCRLHRIGWISPRREWVVRAFLKTAFRVQCVLPDYGKPLPERLPRRRDPETGR
ncbi:hypothetical protein [Streptomyces mirabilis]|uniref:hypothetical protein n=1 Tax=Streptomyces mirabilis TaxID=68239 RepID=UPI0036464C3E